jgi:hypothetical protein
MFNIIFGIFILKCICDYIDKYGDINTMEDMLHEKINICNKAQLISSKIKNTKRIIRICLILLKFFTQIADTKSDSMKDRYTSSFVYTLS